MNRVRMALLGLVMVGGGAVVLWRVAVQAAGAAGQEFHAQLRQIAAEYTDYGSIDDCPHWAPNLCWTPDRWGPVMPHASDSTDGDTHGKKLYFLYVRDVVGYEIGGDQNAGQVLVKESWAPREASAEEAAYSRPAATPWEWKGPRRDPHAVVEKGGKFYRPAEQKELFVMFKVDPATPNTDNGWVYGTVTPDGKTVTSAGRVESCMGCHQDAKNDRLFGPKTNPE